MSAPEEPNRGCSHPRKAHPERWQTNQELGSNKQGLRYGSCQRAARSEGVLLCQPRQKGSTRNILIPSTTVLANKSWFFQRHVHHSEAASTMKHWIKFTVPLSGAITTCVQVRSPSRLKLLLTDNLCLGLPKIILSTCVLNDTGASANTRPRTIEMPAIRSRPQRHSPRSSATQPVVAFQSRQNM